MPKIAATIHPVNPTNSGIHNVFAWNGGSATMNAARPMPTPTRPAAAGLGACARVPM